MKALLLLSGLFIASTAFAHEDVLYTYHGRPDCDGCQPKEFLVESSSRVEHGSYTYVPRPSCSGPSNLADDIVAIVSAGANAYTGNYAGSALALANTSFGQKFISDNIHGELGRALNRRGNATATCVERCIFIPTYATDVRIALGAREKESRAGFRGCLPGQDCSIGFSRWEPNPTYLTKKSSVEAVCSTFMNWIHEGEDRVAMMRVYFKAEGWKPPYVGAMHVEPK